ncbi:Lecithin:cholesterol acyltransferase family protein [Histomonas meleagridis]|uniref:Lecithin:cholesterol acyltransferase family protein n=1 Tax=Histomonas meleagridis TaxID=135588 RepID=UPI00355A4944|nr:Lecithin:cholesterol acyltransferase family protein [Histomonas meleagridis]KAH0805250.1 Lecithin:cholesterol acyltransferase family protein [Histomonas meleagridis]
MPGVFGSQIYGNQGTFSSKYWYCVDKLKEEIVWVDSKYVIPPMFNCLFELLEAYYDESTDKIMSQPGLDLHPHDYGGIEGLDKIVDIFGLQIMESFDSLIDYLVEKGYEVRKNLFGAPYDWRLAVSGLRSSTFFTDLKGLAEQAYNVNKQKVTILGYSLGGMMLSQFLGNTPEITPSWKNKYIEKAIFLAPAYAGAGDTLPISWSRRFPMVKFLSGDAIENAIMNMPCLHVLYPNHVVFKGTTIIVKDDGTKLGPEAVPQFFIDHGKLTGNSIKMLNKNLEISMNAPSDPGVPLLVLYNSKIQTLIGLNFNNGYNNDPTEIYTDGDGTVPSQGPVWGCNNWASNKAIVCYDFKNPSDDFNHAGLSRVKYSLEVIYNYTNNINVGNWHTKSGRRFITAPMVTSNELTYVVENGIRQQSEENYD